MKSREKPLPAQAKNMNDVTTSAYRFISTSAALQRFVDRIGHEAILAVKPTVIVSLAHDRDFWWGVKQDLPEVFLIGRRYEDGRDAAVSFWTMSTMPLVPSSTAMPPGPYPSTWPRGAPARCR